MHAAAQANGSQASAPTTTSAPSRVCSPKPQPNKPSSPIPSPTCDPATCPNVPSSSRRSSTPTKSYGSSTPHASTSQSSKVSSSAASQDSALATSATSDGATSRSQAMTTATPSSCRKHKSPSPTSSTTMPSVGSLLGKDTPTNPSSPCLPPPPSRGSSHNGCNEPASPSTSPSTLPATATPRWHSWQEPTSTPSPNSSDIATSKPPPSMPPSSIPHATKLTTASHASTSNAVKHDAHSKEAIPNFVTRLLLGEGIPLLKRPVYRTFSGRCNIAAAIYIIYVRTRGNGGGTPVWGLLAPPHLQGRKCPSSEKIEERREKTQNTIFIINFIY